MSTQLTPDDAREALAAVQQMKAAGRKLGAWPRWAVIVESIGMAVTITVLGVIGLKWPHVLISLAVGLLGVALRYFFVFRFGAFPKLDWVDGVLALLVTPAAMAGALALPIWTGLLWLAWVPGPLLGLLHLMRTEYVRRATPKTGGGA